MKLSSILTSLPSKAFGVGSPFGRACVGSFGVGSPFGRAWLGLLLLALLTACTGKYQYEEVKGDLSGTRIYTLNNGLKVYLSVNKEEPRIQTYIAVRTGSKNDPSETTGSPTASKRLRCWPTSSVAMSTTARSPTPKRAASLIAASTR